MFPWRTKSGVYKWWRPLCRRLKIDLTPHQFRHAFATELLEAGADDKVVQKGGGRASFESIRRTDQHVREAAIRTADNRRTALVKGRNRKWWRTPVGTAA